MWRIELNIDNFSVTGLIFIAKVNTYQPCKIITILVIIIAFLYAATVTPIVLITTLMYNGIYNLNCLFTAEFNGLFPRLMIFSFEIDFAGIAG